MISGLLGDAASVATVGTALATGLYWLLKRKSPNREQAIEQHRETKIKERSSKFVQNTIKNKSIGYLYDFVSEHQPKKEGVHISAIRTTNELKTLWNIDASEYGEASISYQLFESWWQAFPKGLVALSSDDEVLGALGIWPVSDTWIKEFSSGRSAESTLSPRTIKSAARKTTNHWYISGFVVGDKARRQMAVAKLLGQSISRWSFWPEVRFPVTLYALALSDMGERLLSRRFRFTLLQPGSQMPDKQPLYARTFNEAEDVVATQLNTQGLHIDQCYDFDSYLRLISSVEDELGPRFEGSLKNWCGIGDRPYPLKTWEVFAALDRKNSAQAAIGIYQETSSPDQEFWLGWFGVHPKFRGRGIGQILVRDMERRISRLGGRLVHVYVAPNELDVLSFYERLGYKPSGTMAGHASPQAGSKNDEIIMTKSLS